MSMLYPQSLTYDDWKRIKAATRHRRYLERMTSADEAGEAEWLAAVARDEATDPYAEHVEELEVLT